MLELYLFILSLLAIVAIVVHRLFQVKKDQKKAFKEKISEKVEENRKVERVEESNHFKEEHLREEDAKRPDVARFKEEMRQAEKATNKGNVGEAKKILIQAMALTKDDLPVALKLADLYMQTEDYKRAEALYRSLLERDPENPLIYESIGRIKLKQKAYKEAIQAYVCAVELDEKDDQKFLALGKLYHLMMRYSVAAECFRRAAELKPREVEHLFLLADACVADDDYENALFSYERILTIQPYNQQAKALSHDVRLKMKEEEALFNE